MEQEKFKILSSQIRGKMLRVAKAFSTALPSDESEDIVQEALLTLWQLLENGYPARDKEALAIKITKNVCVAHYRKAKIRTVPLEGRDYPGGSSATAQSDLGDLRLIKDRLFQTLSQSQRECMQLKSQFGLSLDGIAEITGKPKASVKATISQARRIMLEQLKKEI